MVAPRMRLPTRSIRKIKNIIFAIDAAPSAMPVNPSKAAISAITRKFVFIYYFKFGPNLSLPATYFV
jgi:hypothetical protein